MFMTMFTTVCPLSLSWVISIHFTTFHYISDMHFNIILPSTPCFSNWPCSSHPYMPHVPFTLPSLIFHWYSRCRWEDNIEGKQRTYNIILRCFSVNTVAAEQQLVLYIVRVCLQHYLSKTHSTCATLYWLLQYLLTSCERHKRKKLLNTKCVCWFPLQLLS